MKDENNVNEKCPSCGDPFPKNEIRCSTCQYEPHDVKDRWKPENLGKQHGKPLANRTGKAKFK